MKEQHVDTDWRTVQVFISSQAAGVFEVEVDTTSRGVRCNCPVWKKHSLCKHTDFVVSRMRKDNGNYSIQIPNDVPEEMAIEASDDAQSFREFVLKYAKIEVI